MLKIKNDEGKHMLFVLKKIILYIVFWILFLWLLLLIWAISRYTQVEIEKIIFHIRMPLKGSPFDWAEGIFTPVIFSLSFAIIIVYLYIISNKQFQKVILFFLFSLFLINCYLSNNFFSISDYFKSNSLTSNFIQDNYVFPKQVKIGFPMYKKNLIFIMAESLESSYQNTENGGLFQKNYIPELTNVANKNISFSHSDKIEGCVVLPQTGWTIAGLVAETAGIPLKLWGFSYTPGNTFVDDIDNSLGLYQYFLPGVISIGDILYREGYNNYFILGRDSSFAGQKEYFQQHGHYQILDREVISKLESVPQKNINDKELFKFVEQYFSKIPQNRPFHIILKTVDTHFGDKEKFLLFSKELSEFIEWIQLQPFYENTTIVILGDHCNMKQTDFKGIEDRNFRYLGNMKRKVFNVFINSSIQPIQEKNRKFSTMDMFPTMIAAIGGKIEGNRLGLGTNLFSEEKTLPEIYGYDYLFQELKKESKFYQQKLLFK